MGLEVDIATIADAYFTSPSTTKTLVTMLVEELENKYYVLDTVNFDISEMFMYMVSANHGFVKAFYASKMMFFEQEKDKTMFLLMYG
jgi:hypothetical protein